MFSQRAAVVLHNAKETRTRFDPENKESAPGMPKAKSEANKDEPKDISDATSVVTHAMKVQRAEGF